MSSSCLQDIQHPCVVAINIRDKRVRQKMYTVDKSHLLSWLEIQSQLELSVLWILTRILCLVGPDISLSIRPTASLTTRRFPGDLVTAFSSEALWGPPRGPLGSLVHLLKRIVPSVPPSSSVLGGGTLGICAFPLCLLPCSGEALRGPSF